ncbi:MAG TPA: M6 family metalloprotease domain-containing protein [Candidatus Poseidoniaceae archaeon]|nr:M6 family metalloprotease domain-containing protein [Candidatus Poseidoniaceae archaeon]
MQRMLTLIAALAFLSIGGWSILNQDVVDTWIVERSLIDEQHDETLVGLQANETWLVLVVDFESNPSNGIWGPEQARNLLNQSSFDYFHQISGNTTQVELIVHPEVIRANHEMAYYGEDSSNRDVDGQGNFMPSKLALEAVEAVSQTIDWSPFDLDNDGSVDRLLILHTTKGQEENPGAKSRIWSHFTHFESPVEVVDEKTVAHYTMASLQTGTSGIGTIMHEMLHQMGAVDLYPVHDDVPSQTWKGLGEWDVMASGNWNGGGQWPALPSGGSMELIGAGRSVELDLTWPEQSASPCIGPSVNLLGTSESGEVLKIPIGTEEFVLIERRTDSGYDSRLPGHGILVTYLDMSAGEMDQNEVNTNPQFPFLMVIEADGEQNLVSGSNEGEPSDVFTNGTMFGAQGITIRNHDGVFVDWTATVSGDNHSTVSFTSQHCSPSFGINLPDYSATILPGEKIPIVLNNEGPCESNLVASDGRTVNLVSDEEKVSYSLEFTQAGMSNALTVIEGEISCGDDDKYFIQYPVLTLNRIPLESQFKSSISSVSDSTVLIPIDSYGNNSQRISVKIDGPLSRIAQGDDFVMLEGDAYYTLQISPNDLLSNNMLVRGELILYTEEGGEWIVTIELNAGEDEEIFLEEWRAPGRVIGLTGIIIGIYLLFGLLMANKIVEKNPETIKEVQSIQVEPQTIIDADPWGRPIDSVTEHDSLGPLDVEKFP